MEVSGQLCPQGKDPRTHWIGGWISPRAGLDTMAKRKKIPALLGIEPQSCRPPPSQYTD